MSKARGKIDDAGRVAMREADADIRRPEPCVDRFRVHRSASGLVRSDRRAGDDQLLDLASRPRRCGAPGRRDRAPRPSTPTRHAAGRRGAARRGRSTRCAASVGDQLGHRRLAGDRARRRRPWSRRRDRRSAPPHRRRSPCRRARACVSCRSASVPASIFRDVDVAERLVEGAAGEAERRRADGRRGTRRASPWRP